MKRTSLWAWLAFTMACSGPADLGGASATDAGPDARGAATGNGAPQPGPSPAAPDGSVCAAAGAPKCAPSRNVASASELLAEIGKLAWQPVGLGKSAVLTLSDDLTVTADIDIAATSLTAPTSSPCELVEPPLGSRCPLFRTYAFPSWGAGGDALRVAGITCAELGPQPVRKGSTCAKLHIKKGTTFRLRATIEDMHPDSYYPFVEVERPCSEACPAGTERCGATQTCFTNGFEFCAYCEGLPLATCVCREGCTDKKNGASCNYDSSPDTVVSGTCSGGTCQP